MLKGPMPVEYKKPFSTTKASLRIPEVNVGSPYNYITVIRLYNQYAAYKKANVGGFCVGMVYV